LLRETELDVGYECHEKNHDSVVLRLMKDVVCGE